MPVSWRDPGAEPSASRSPVCFWRRSDMDSPMLQDLAAAAVQFAALAQTTDPSSALTSTRGSSDRPVRSAHDLTGGCRCPAGEQSRTWPEAGDGGPDQATGDRDEERWPRSRTRSRRLPNCPRISSATSSRLRCRRPISATRSGSGTHGSPSKQFEAGWKKAREKADGEAEALKEARGALETDRAALTERSDQLGEREAEIARAELALEEQRSVAKAGFAPDLRAMTQGGRAAAGRDPRRGRTA